ncbi:hypothetical protein [Nocardia shimofusensis]|uniref:hypothetical protein n=1 Tax=Nocardia shimofusensis TaxID=228596 RepID=UPI0008367FA2|nr:hypothetical protein [Nocardia shimofusensis]
MGQGQDQNLIRLIVDALSSGISDVGFAVEEMVDGRDGIWFYREMDAFPSAKQRISAHIASRRDGGVAIRGHAYLASAAIGQVAVGLPIDAQLDDDHAFIDCVDLVGFGTLARPRDYSLVFPVPDESGFDSGVGKFMQYVIGPVSTWFSERDSIDRLIELARTPTSGVTPENIRPDRLRGTVIMCLVEGRPDDAAALMHWYLGREHFNVADSLERARAFNAALAENFPHYAPI